MRDPLNAELNRVIAEVFARTRAERPDAMTLTKMVIAENPELVEKLALRTGRKLADRIAKEELARRTRG